MWQFSISEHAYTLLPPPQRSAWVFNEDGSYSVDWDCPKLQKKVQDMIMKGCSSLAGQTFAARGKEGKTMCGHYRQGFIALVALMRDQMRPMTETNVRSVFIGDTDDEDDGKYL